MEEQGERERKKPDPEGAMERRGQCPRKEGGEWLMKAEMNREGVLRPQATHLKQGHVLAIILLALLCRCC